MKVFGVVGPGAADLAGRLADRLGTDARVATVERVSGERVDGGARTARQSPGVATTYVLEDERRTAAGTDLSLEDALDRLAPDHDYAVVVGIPEAAIPQVALGGRDHRGSSLAAAPDPDGVSLDAVQERVEALEARESLASLVARAKRSPAAERAGAIATFTGRVRARDAPGDDPTRHLEFEKYEGVADERLAALEADLEAREGVYEVHLHHRTGVIEYGRDIVFVVVLAGHREEAFRTVEDGIDRLKDEVPLFKKEVTVDEEFWVHERE